MEAHLVAWAQVRRWVESEHIHFTEATHQASLNGREPQELLLKINTQPKRSVKPISQALV